jgi:hypothetical protein
VSRRGDARAEGALLHACFARVLKLDQLGISYSAPACVMEDSRQATVLLYSKLN